MGWLHATLLTVLWVPHWWRTQRPQGALCLGLDCPRSTLRGGGGAGLARSQLVAEHHSLLPLGSESSSIVSNLGQMLLSGWFWTLCRHRA